MFYLSLIIAVIGLIVYALANGKAAEAGRIAFACGLLAFLIEFGGHAVR